VRSGSWLRRLPRGEEREGEDEESELWKQAKREMEFAGGEGGGIGGLFIFSCGGENFDGRSFSFFLGVGLVISKVIRR